MAKPRIGLTTYRQRAQSGIWDLEMAFIPSFYVDAVHLAGGLAVLLPPQEIDSTEANTILDGLDGLIVTGGRDVDPAKYNQAPHETTDQPDLLRDLLESKLLEAAIERDFPFLGICRGAQLLNVVSGGTLTQHLPEKIGSDKYQLGNGVFAPVPVEVKEDTRLHSLVGDEVPNAAMYHHQAIDEVGKNLVVSALSEDGVIEGIELPKHSFGVAVQWHPEQNLEDLRIFEALVKAAGSRRN